jgi:hypothetical protein
MDKTVLTVYLQGVRDDSYTKKSTGEHVPRFMADLYHPGTGSFSLPVNTTVYAQLINLPPMVTQFKLPYRLEPTLRVVKLDGGGSYARQEMGVQFGDLEQIEQGRKQAAV